MSRHVFGNTLTDWAMSIAGGTNQVSVVPGAVVTFWTALSGGTQITDLQDNTGGAITSVTADSNGNIGGGFFGPDQVLKMAADANAGAGPRSWIMASDIDAECLTLEGNILTANAGIAVNTGVLSGAPQWVFATNSGWPPRPATSRPVFFVNTVSAGAPPISTNGGADGGSLPGDVYLGP